MRKLSIAEVATYTKISENSLRKFEAGEAEPSFNQLARLSDLYNVPLYAFYRVEDLKFEDTLPDFRKTHPEAADLSPRGLTRLWQVERRATFVEELVSALGRDAPTTATLRRLTNRTTPNATELRVGFDRWLSERQNALKFPGPREEVFLRHARLFLDVHGCSSSINNAPVDDYLGFFAEFSKHGKVVFINREVKHPKRRLFTFAHELAHFIYNEEGVSNPFVIRNDIERRCNAYAAEFLAPDDRVMAIVRSAAAPLISDTMRLINFVSGRTLLSRQASALRLEELGVITKRAASAFFAHIGKLKRIVEVEPEPAEKRPMGAGAAIGKKLSEVGVYAAYAASIAKQKKIIDVVDVERGLGIPESIQERVLNLATRRFEASAD